MTHTAIWDWGDNTTTSSSEGEVTESEGHGTVTGSHAYTTPGIYIVTLNVTDNDGESDTAQFRYAIIYDPNDGFVTAGGWINSPEGAYVDDPALTGKVVFGFVTKYQEEGSTTTPSGKTKFYFKGAGLNFESTGHQWLVVSGAKAYYKGEGTINDVGNYGFLLCNRCRCKPQ